MKIAYTILIARLMSFTCAYTMDDDKQLVTNTVDGWEALTRAEKKQMRDTVDIMGIQYNDRPEENHKKPLTDPEELGAAITRAWRDVRHAMRKGAPLPKTEQEYNEYLMPNIQWAENHRGCTEDDVSDISSTSDGSEREWDDDDDEQMINDAAALEISQVAPISDSEDEDEKQ